MKAGLQFEMAVMPRRSASLCVPQSILLRADEVDRIIYQTAQVRRNILTSRSSATGHQPPPE
jgi:hypothetical protein